MNPKKCFQLTAACTFVAAGLIGCTSTAPAILRDARASYRAAASGDAGKTAQPQLQNAKNALARAEAAFDDSGDSRDTRDLAYIAERLSRLADAQAKQQLAAAEKKAAENELELAQTELNQRNQNQLLAARDQAADAQHQLELERQRGNMTEQEAAAARAEARDARSQTEAARKELEDERMARIHFQEQLAAAGDVRDEARGTIVAVSGSLLFSSGSSKIRPGASDKLMTLANVMKKVPTRHIIIEGHTDSSGSDAKNQALSEARARAVRSFLIEHGVKADQVEAVGMGESDPIADNSSAEGRAENRRVEVVIEKEEPAA